MACHQESLPSFAKMVVLLNRRPCYMYILLVSSFLMKSTSIGLRNPVLNVA